MGYCDHDDNEDDDTKEQKYYDDVHGDDNGYDDDDNDDNIDKKTRLCLWLENSLRKFILLKCKSFTARLESLVYLFWILDVSPQLLTLLM